MLLEHLQWCSVYEPANFIFFTSKFSYVLFRNLTTDKTETGTAYMWGTTNSKPPEQQQLDHVFITLFSAKFKPFTSQNYFHEPNQHMLGFLHPIFVWRITDGEHGWRCSYVVKFSLNYFDF